MKAVAKKTIADQDWKTQLALKYSNIPVGAIVDVINPDLNNLYGSWCEIMWNNRHYYVHKNDLDFSDIGLKIAEENNDEINKYKQFFI